jgi:iron complex outermembrane receptor protein
VGNKLPHVPAYTLNAGVQTDHRLSDNLQLVARVDFQRLGQTWFHTVQDNVVPTMFGSNANFSRLERDPFNLVNVRLGLKGNRWDATLWSRNVFNKEYITEVSAAPEFGGGFASPGHGRTFGADVAYRF